MLCHDGVTLVQLFSRVCIVHCCIDFTPLLSTPIYRCITNVHQNSPSYVISFTFLLRFNEIISNFYK